VCVADLVVYDTLDEAWGRSPPPTRGNALAVVRDLRRTARLQRTAVVATCRVAPADLDLAGVARAWRTHPWHESILDASDIVVLLADAEAAPYIHVVVDSRISRRASCQLRQDPITGQFTDDPDP
jgi:hypothetical protein